MNWEATLADFTDRDWELTDDISMTRFAIVGLGWWGRTQAIPAVEESDFGEVTVVVSRSKERAREVATTVDGIHHALTYEAFHNGAHTDAYDAVYICTPNATHLEFAHTAARYDKDILCEKPLEATVERAQQLAHTCEMNGVRLMTAYRMHTEPAVRGVRKLFQDGFIGDPVAIHGHMSATLLEVNPDPDQWRLDPKLSGGCSLIDIGLYPLNTTRFILGVEPTSVMGMTTSPTDAFQDVDERVGFQLLFPNDAIAVYTASHNAVWSSHLKLIGTEGFASIEPAFSISDDRVVRLKRGEMDVTVEYEQVNQMLEMFDRFAYYRATEETPEAAEEHGVTDLKLVDAIYEASDNGVRYDLR